MRDYPRAQKYPDLDQIYSQCSGPGALRTAEFVADAMGLRSDWRVVDIGMFRGGQTCFLAREYGCQMVGVDPGLDNYDPNGDGQPYVEKLSRNAEAWGVADRVLGVQVGVPDLKFSDSSFDAAYSTTAFEMIRGFMGEAHVQTCMEEVWRVLRPGGVFGLAEPMRRKGPPPEDLAPLVSRGQPPFKDFLSTPSATADTFRAAGFDVLEADYVPDAQDFWQEFIRHDWDCKENPDDNPPMIKLDGGRWIDFGFVIAQKPT